MKNYHSARSGILALLLFAFTFAQAQMVITPTVTPACAAGTGAVTFAITGGTGTTTFYLQNLRTGASFNPQSSPTFTNLSIGEYQVFAINSLDSGTLQFNITGVVSGSATWTNATCTQSDGSATVTPSGGTGPYTYLWDNGMTTATISNVPASFYSMHVTDANGCVSDTINAYVMAASTLSASIAVTNSGTCNQTLTASATGGQIPYAYTWNTGATTTALANLSGNATYTVNVTDANGCTASQSSTISSTTLQLDSGGAMSPSCSNNNGSITVTVQNGVSPYSYVWSPSGAGSTISGLSAGTYTVTATDANGCTGSQTYYLYQNPVSAYAYATTPPTCGNADGTAEVYASGGNGIYTYIWSTADQTQNVSGLAAGTYTVTATDGTACSASATLTMTGVANYTVSVTTTPTACNTAISTGTATAIVTGSGGTAPYSFAWYNSPPYGQQGPVIGTTQTITNLAVGTSLYVSVLDANGCLPAQQNYYDTVSIQFDPACYDHITGYAFGDLNANCTKDPGEQGMQGANVSATGSTGQTYWASTDSTGFYDIAVLPGSYTINAIVYNYGGCTTSTCATSYAPVFTTNGQISSGNDFGFDGSPSFDLGVHMGYQGSAPGGTREYWVYYYNWGSTSVANGVLTFIHDPNITLTSTSPPYTTYNPATYTITWNINNNLSPMYWLDAAHQVIMYYDIPPTLPLGTLLTAHADIAPIAGDCDPTDNIQNLTDLVSASHDPNEKEVSPAGNLTASDTVLTYTLRFQNDGNAPASRIVITDTLSSNLDAGTAQLFAFSHPCKMTLSGQGILTFTFDAINLPDSVHDVAHSKGFVSYTVHTKKNLPLFSQINNTAYIYFDINSAVVTNTTVSVRSDYQTSVKNVNGNGALAVTVSPNPVQSTSIVHISGATGDVSFDLTDVTGQKVMETSTSRQDITLDSEMFASGMYLYTVKDASGATRTGKVLITH